MFDGLLVVGGRLKHASILSGIKNPIILPRDHHVSRMIVQEYHENTHLGVEWVLSRIRCKFWIVNARNMVKRACVTCKRLYAAPMNQNMAGFPPERCLPNVRPFSYTGLDFFGPFYVKIGWSQVKRYGCVFTCFSTRAIHLEMAVSLDTDAFINAVIRFVSRRGAPQEVWSDNGTNLVGGHAELKHCLQQVNHDSIVQAARRQNVDWTFNPPLASHHGGVWERMIRVVRRVLLALLTSSPIMTDDILHTVKIWLTVGHWPRVVTMSTMKTLWPLIICWWWKAMSPFLGVCLVRPMFTDVTGDVCNTLPTSPGEDGS